MFFPWFLYQRPPVPPFNPWGYPAIPPVFGRPTPANNSFGSARPPRWRPQRSNRGTPSGNSLLVNSNPEPPRMATNNPDALIPAGVKVVADLPADRPEYPNRPYNHMAWSPNGRYLLYTGAPDREAIRPPLMLLDLNDPTRPRPVVETPHYDGVAWHPDGQSFVYMGMYQDPSGRSVPTIYRKRLGDAEPINLLYPAVTEPPNLGFIHRWLDDHTLAFDEGVGTGLRRVLRFDTAERRLFENPEMAGSYFMWSPRGERLAGQYFAGPPDVVTTSFWLWDRREDRFLLPEMSALPGNQQWFEAWSPDGRLALFTAWDGEPYQPGSNPTLYLMDPQTRQVAKVADNAGLAAWSRDWIAYVRWGPRLTLVVARATDNQVLWTDDLGPFPEQGALEGPMSLGQVFPWTYWPRFAGPYIAYRTSAGQWRVSSAERKTVRPVYRGQSVELLWSPDARHLALLHTNETAHLTVVENPFQGTSALTGPNSNPDHTNPNPGRTNSNPGHTNPEMTEADALKTEGNEICLTGEARVEVIMPPFVTPESIPIPIIAFRLDTVVQGQRYNILLEPGEELDLVNFGEMMADLHTKRVSVCGITQGINPMYGPVVKVTYMRGM